MNNEAQSFYSLADDTKQSPDELWQYVQSLSPDMVAHMSQPQSQEVQEAMERNIIGLVGTLSGEGFNVSITMTRENLGHLLASAMMGGYFLRNAEQRLTVEKALQDQFLNLPE